MEKIAKPQGSGGPIAKVTSIYEVLHLNISTYSIICQNFSDALEADLAKYFLPIPGNQDASHKFQQT